MAGFTDPEAAGASEDPKRLMRLFQDAMQAGQSGDPERADKIWTEAIELNPKVAPSWSNRGTLRLQMGRWADAAADLQVARELEEEAAGGSSGVNALLLNNLANCKVALGEYAAALEDYALAAREPEMAEIAEANAALTLFQMGRDAEAVRAARALLRRDPAFLDMRAAVTAFQWALGREAEAEADWEQLKGASDGLGAALYSSTARVKGRWPPRATAALEAFMALERRGQAVDYDLQTKTYTF